MILCVMRCGFGVELVRVWFVLMVVEFGCLRFWCVLVGFTVCRRFGLF